MLKKKETKPVLCHGATMQSFLLTKASVVLLNAPQMHHYSVGVTIKIK